MSSSFPIYAFEDGKVVAFHGKQVIASGTDFEKVSGDAEEYFSTLRQEHEHKTADEARKAATHIVTPNGAKGVILGRTSSIWSDEITVRFENGQFRRYATYVGDGLKYATEQPDAPKSPVEYFQRKLDEAIVPGREGLTARLEDLDEIRRGASHLASQGVSYQDAQELDKIVLTAGAEHNEVSEALAHLVAADAEAMVPPKMAYTAVEQADLGRSDSWLEIVAQEMVAEADAQDYDKLLNEGPTQLVSSLENLDHAGTVREMALEFIHSKTAGFQGQAVEDYRDQFMASVEQARKRELTYRQDAVREEIQKEAKVADNLPDDALFL